MAEEKQSHWKRRSLFIITGIVLVIISATWLLGSIAKRDLAQSNPPPGQLITVNGIAFHIHCIGDGTPTVIMEAGLNDFSLTWSRVQADIAQFSRVCVYDRAGLAWSETSTLPRTSQQMITELHQLLENAAITPPYILVGHSFGGINVRLYANQYPDEVVGMLLIDASHEDMFNRIPYFAEATRQAITQFRTFSIMSNLGLLALSPEEIPTPDLPQEAVKQYRVIIATTNYFETAIAESSAFEESLSQLASIEPQQLDMPLIVLSRGQAEPLQGMPQDEIQAYESAWSQMQSELTQLSSNSKQIIAQNSGHYIQLSEPQLVIDAVHELVLSLRELS